MVGSGCWGRGQGEVNGGEREPDEGGGDEWTRGGMDRDEDRL